MEEIERFKVLNTDQIQKLCFPNLKSGDRICRNAIQRLRDKQKKIYSNRIVFNEPAYHFIDKKYKNHPQIDHILLTNWTYIYLKNNLSKSEIPFYFQHEYDYPTLRADGFIGINNLMLKKKIFYFVETDLSHNTFDKISKYNSLYENVNEWKDDWWIALTDGFPAIIIVTYRKKYVMDKISVENKNRLLFKVYNIDEIKC